MSDSIPAATFADGAARNWSTKITVATIERVREQMGVDLLDVFDGKLFGRLADDVVLLARVCWWVIEPQAKTANVSDIEFAESFSGDVIDDAGNALVGGIIRFFGESRRNVLANLWATVRKANAASTDLVNRKISSAKVEQVVRSVMAKAEREIDNELDKLIESPDPTTTTTTTTESTPNAP